jgi:hypothetical protein
MSGAQIQLDDVLDMSFAGIKISFLHQILEQACQGWMFQRVFRISWNRIQRRKQSGKGSVISFGPQVFEDDPICLQRLRLGSRGRETSAKFGLHSHLTVHLFPRPANRLYLPLVINPPQFDMPEACLDECASSASRPHF